MQSPRVCANHDALFKIQSAVSLRIASRWSLNGTNQLPVGMAISCRHCFHHYCNRPLYTFVNMTYMRPNRLESMLAGLFPSDFVMLRYINKDTTDCSVCNKIQQATKKSKRRKYSVKEMSTFCQLDPSEQTTLKIKWKMGIFIEENSVDNIVFNMAALIRDQWFILSISACVNILGQ